MRDDLTAGNPFPDLRLPDHTGRELALSEIADGQPLVLCFLRGWWCPKEQVRLRTLVLLQEELTREYGALAAVTVDSPYANGALRAGVGASFPFLSDEERRVARELDLVELSDAKHLPFIPFTFVLDSRLRIHRIWCGFWFWGNPTPEELRQAMREITRAEQPTFDPQPVWAEGGSAPAGAGIEGAAVWIREDAAGREIQRGAYDGELPDVGAEVGRSRVDGRPWLVHAVDREDSRPAVHLRKGGEPDANPLPQHHLTVPPSAGA
jgi:peroxiredoxin